MDLAISDDAARGRLQTIVDGQHCVLDYRVDGGVLAIVHTGVPSQVGGRGIAAALVQRAFEIARARDLKVDPVCAYAAVWLRRHPQFAELVVSG